MALVGQSAAAALPWADVSEASVPKSPPTTKVRALVAQGRRRARVVLCLPKESSHLAKGLEKEGSEMERNGQKRTGTGAKEKGSGVTPTFLALSEPRFNRCYEKSALSLDFALAEKNIISGT
jgi:hypothetical protein